MPEVKKITRKKIEEEFYANGIKKMYSYLKEIDLVAANRIHPNDTQRIKRAIEIYRETGKQMSILQKENISINSGQGDLILRILPTFNDPNEVVTEGSLTAPMPGKIIKINAKLNKSVKAGETLLILEAMKMEHAVKAVSDGKISEMYVKTGDQVESGANLLKID